MSADSAKPDRPLDVSYDRDADMVTIDGKLFAGNFFRALVHTMPLGALFRVVDRNAHGIWIEQVDFDRLAEAAVERANRV